MNSGAPIQPIPGWLCFFVAALAEYLFISYNIDAQDILGPAGWDEVLGQVGVLVPLAFLVVVATLLTGGTTTRSALLQLVPFRSSRVATAGYAALHLLLYIGSLLLAQQIAGIGEGRVSEARLQVLLWVLLLLGSWASLALALWPGRVLVAALLQTRTAMAIGATLGVVAWGAGIAAQSLWKPLAWLTLEVVHALLTVIASDPVALLSENLVGTSRFYITVSPVCSGVEGIGLMLVFMAAFLYLERDKLRWPRSFLLLPLSALLIWLLNAVRLTALVAVGTWVSPEIALGGFHSKAGWVMFTLAALGAIVLVRRTEFFRHRLPLAPAQRAPAERAGELASESQLSPTPQLSRSQNGEVGAPEFAYLLPLLSVLALSLISGLAVTGFDYFYPLRVVLALGLLFRYRRHYPALIPGSPWLGIAAGGFVALIWIAGFQPPIEVSQSDTGQVLSGLPPLWAGLWLLCRLVGAVLTVPVIEELAFRGYLMRRLSARDFDQVPFRSSGWPGFVVSSLAFGALHSQWVLGLVAGAVFGLLAMARSRLSDAILAHAVANLGVAIYVLFSGNFALW